MHLVPPVFRPPSEARSLILQATLGCSWNHCTYCAMYRGKEYRVRPIAEVLADVATARARLGPGVDKVFVADGDALAAGMAVWEPLLAALRDAFPRCRQVSSYATARNVLALSTDELTRLRAAGLRLVYLGPESGDDATLRAVAKGATAAEHVEAAARLRAAGIRQSVILLLGIAGLDGSERHARASGRLVTAMDPDYLAALTVTVVPGTPLARQVHAGLTLPEPLGMLRELRMLLEEAAPTGALFRTNHASNYLPLRGRLPDDRHRLLALLDDALAGRVGLRPESWRGL